LAVSRHATRRAQGVFHVRNNVYVGNLQSAEAGELEVLLAQFGVVRFAAVVAGEEPGLRDGFGVVEMQTEAEAATAIRTLNGFEVRGRALTVRWATAPEQTACGHPAMFSVMNMSDAV
jgi:RNA recognition motif-containing protein